MAIRIKPVVTPTDSLQKLLYQKYLDKNLASLYIAKYDSSSTDPEEWVSQFIAQITPLLDHPDVLKVFKDEKKGEKKGEKEQTYKVDSLSIKHFLKFLNYAPLVLSKKFIFLFDAHDLSEIVSNKLLKIFEELGATFCLILMVPDNAPMLATVESRSIKLQIPKPLSDLIDQKQKGLDVQTPYELIAQQKLNGDFEKDFIEGQIEKTLSRAKSKQNSPESYSELSSLLHDLEHFEEASRFNNSKLSRITPFFR